MGQDYLKSYAILRLFRGFGDKICNNKIEKRSVWLQKRITEKKTPLISSSFTKMAEELRRSTYRADTEAAVSTGKRSRSVLAPSVRVQLRAKRREMRKDFHRSFWYTEGRNLFLISSPSRTPLHSSLPVTVFAFA